jgi:hypothetical protein
VAEMARVAVGAGQHSRAHVVVAVVGNAWQA